MNKICKFFIILLALSSSYVFGNEKIEIEWQDPEQFRDIRSSNESQKRFQKRVIKTLESHLVKLSQSLPDGHKLSLVVTDLDLAGRVLPAFYFGGSASQEMRVIERVDVPRISFSYTLMDDQNVELSSAEVDLKDLAFMDGIASRRRVSDSLRFEKQLLTDWFTNDLNRSSTNT